MTRWAIAMTVALLGTGAASAAVQTKTIDYEYAGTKLKGFLAYDDAAKGKLPGVLVFPEWTGLNDYAKDRAKQLAGMGYVAFAGDLYGDGKVVSTEEAMKQATGLRNDAKTWRGRAAAALATLTAQPNVDADKVAAIGYCLGGSTAIQLALSGANLQAVCTFHAGLPTITVEEANKIKAELLINNGADDKFVSEKSITAFKDALEKSNVRFRFENYPGTVHSFTVPDADKANNPGMKYNKDADEKSWKLMKELFEVKLGK